MDFKSLKNRSFVINYCLNVMRKRTVDEQLQDFCEIMESSLKLQITYGKTDLEVKYEIGQHTASVRGLDEMECVQQCKIDILHAIRAFCSFTKNPNKRLHRRLNVSDEFENGDSNSDKDVYSERRLVKNRQYDENTEDDNETSNEMVLIDPEVEQLKSNATGQTTRSPASTTDPAELPLVLEIRYSKTVLKVSYVIGRYSASVVGVVESTCLRQCKLELFDKFKEHRHNANVIDSREARAGLISFKASEKTASRCELDRDDQITTSNDRESLPVRCPKTSGDLYAESATSPETSEKSDLHQTDNKNDVIVNGSTCRNTKIIDQVTRGNSTVDGTASQAVQSLKTSVRAIEVDVDTAAITPRASYQTAGINIWGKCIFDSNENFMSLNMNGSSGGNDETRRPNKNCDIKNRSSNKPNESQNVVQSHPRTINLTTIPSTSCRSMELSSTIRSIVPIMKSAIENVAELMDNLQPNLLSASIITLLNILKEAKTGYPFNFERIMDVIVQKASDKPDKSELYAQLCFEANKKALADMRDDVQQALPGNFKDELINACDRVLKAGGVLRKETYMQTRFSTRILPQCPKGPANPPRYPELLDANEYIRILGTCKFMGELFVRNSFNIIDVIIRTVGAFIKARDAYSLECLCILLMTIGPKFEKINSSTTQMSAQQVYNELVQCSVAGSRDNSLPKRTLCMINELLRTRHSWVERPQPLSVNRYPSSIPYRGRMQSEYRERRINNNNRPAPGFTSLRSPNDERSHSWNSGRTHNSKQIYGNKKPTK